MKQIIKKNIRAIIIALIALINVLIVLNGNYPCPWRKTLNIYCAGCGGTRMVRAILKLDFYQAFRYNPLLFLITTIGIIYTTYIIICKLKKVKYYQLNVKHLIILAIITITFMILRNIEIFSYLQPTNI